eukprot:CAMPEP_0118926670 /NCGR_PEP_ID=MMETSP1169-20130426/4301_1 /TAXON_ID=36882 /ORGANISM="Pyramimonas obovata, Strain CCMP722" /LENGTH=438 /DNA_ID=CAMNT_0006868265 /DNA_START=356 /DNA_END=1669 /DNA_ORIENTATION=-
MAGEAQGQWQAVPSKAQKAKEAKEKKNTDAKKEFKPQKPTYAAGSLASQNALSVQSAFAALDALAKKQNEAEGITYQDDSDSEEEVANQSVEVVEKKPKVKKPKVKKVKVTIAQISSEVLKIEMLGEALQSLEARYPSNPEVQLGMFATFFEKTFKAVELPFNKLLREEPLAKSAEAPLSELPQPIARKVQQWLSHRPAAAVSKFAMEVLQVIAETGGGASGGKKAQPVKPVPVGLVLVLALALRAHPEALAPAAAGMQKQRSKLLGPERLPILVWACAQASAGAAAAGVALWARLLLPLLAKDPAAKPADLAMDFLDHVAPAGGNKARREALDRRAAKAGGPDAVMPVDALTMVLSVAYLARLSKDGKDRPSAPAVQRLRAHHPRLRQLALAPGGRSGRTAQFLVAASMDMLAHVQVAIGQDGGNRTLSQKLSATGG